MAERLPADTNLLELRPRRLARWEESDGRVVLHRPAPVERGLHGLLVRVSAWLAPPRVRLDEVGSAAWRSLDGARTVAAVAAVLRTEFGDACEPAEERLGRLVRMLRRDGFLALPPWDGS